MTVRDSRSQQSSGCYQAKRIGTASGFSDLFSATTRHEKEMQCRERIRMDLVREHFETDSRPEVAGKLSLAQKLINCLRLD